MKFKEKFNKRLEKLDKLKDKWDDCEECDLYKHRKQVVFWRGHPCAKLALIGEGPGQEEDERGFPFVGSSGKELNSMIKDVGLNIKKDVFIMNVIGCRPLNNRTPFLREVSKCRARTERMLQIIKPEAVVLLGGSAASSLAGITNIGSWKGRLVKIHLLHYDMSFIAVPTYHPSYYLRRGKSKEVRSEIIKHIRFAWDIKGDIGIIDV